METIRITTTETYSFDNIEIITIEPNFELKIIEFNNNKIFVYYSFGNIIAMKKDNILKIAINDWSLETGKHLDFLNPDKEIRIDQNIIKQEIIKFLKNK